MCACGGVCRRGPIKGPPPHAHAARPKHRARSRGVCVQRVVRPTTRHPFAVDDYKVAIYKRFLYVPPLTATACALACVQQSLKLEGVLKLVRQHFRARAHNVGTHACRTLPFGPFGFRMVLSDRHDLVHHECALRRQARRPVVGIARELERLQRNVEALAAGAVLCRLDGEPAAQLARLAPEVPHGHTPAGRLVCPRGRRSSVPS